VFLLCSLICNYGVTLAVLFLYHVTTKDTYMYLHIIIVLNCYCFMYLEVLNKQKNKISIQSLAIGGQYMPRFTLWTIDSRSFEINSVAEVLKVEYRLPESNTSATSLSTFRQRLKTRLFGRAIPHLVVRGPSFNLLYSVHAKHYKLNWSELQIAVGDSGHACPRWLVTCVRAPACSENISTRPCRTYNATKRTSPPAVYIGNRLAYRWLSVGEASQKKIICKFNINVYWIVQVSPIINDLINVLHDA